MNPDLQQRISAIKAECEEILRKEQLIAGPGKWSVGRDDSGRPCVMRYEWYVAEMTEYSPGNGKECTMTENASFIAHARNVSPAMARVVLGALAEAEKMKDMEGGDMWLESIADQWDGKP